MARFGANHPSSHPKTLKVREFPSPRAPPGTLGEALPRGILSAHLIFLGVGFFSEIFFFPNFLGEPKKAKRETYGLWNIFKKKMWLVIYMFDPPQSLSLFFNKTKGADFLVLLLVFCFTSLVKLFCQTLRGFGWKWLFQKCLEKETTWNLTTLSYSRSMMFYEETRCLHEIASVA